MAIDTMYMETLALRNLHRARAALCTVPGDPPLPKYNWFDNRNYLLDLDAVLASCKNLKFFQLHIPDYTVSRMVDWLTSMEGRLRMIPEVHLNILLFNIDNIQGQNVQGLKKFGTVTATTAHEAYTSAATREKFNITIHGLGACTGPEHFSLTTYKEKQPLLVVSHDEHPLREQVLKQISNSFPELRIEIVQNLHYRDYRNLIERAKWSLTFGEGLDAYFYDQVMNGGVAFAVFNDRYFTSDFAKLETVYASWQALIDQMPSDMKRLDGPAAYEQNWQQAYQLVSKLHSVETYRKNLRLFYAGEYTFP